MTIKRRISAESSSNRRKSLVGTPSCSSTIVLPSEIKEEELAWKNELLPGVRFVPSQEDFIYYLLKKVYTGSIDFGGVIRDIDLYKYEPENLKDLAFEGESRLYFFTPLQKRYANGTRNKRETVYGFWKGTQTTKTILVDSDNKHVVTKTPFSYYHPRGKNAKKTQWLMDEYKLSDHDENPHVMLKKWALCVVHYKKRGGNDNDDEKEDGKSSNTKKSSSAGSGFEAMRSTSQTLMIGSASEYALTVQSGQTPTPSKHTTISFGNNYSSVGSSTSSQPQPNWSCDINPQKRQCFLSDQSLLTRPLYNIASHDQGHPSQSQFPKSTACGIVNPNCDQTQLLDLSLADRLNPHNLNMINDLSPNNNVSWDQMLSDFDFDDPSFSECLYTILHDDIPHSSLPQQRDDA